MIVMRRLYAFLFEKKEAYGLFLFLASGLQTQRDSFSFQAQGEKEETKANRGLGCGIMRCSACLRYRSK